MPIPTGQVSFSQIRDELRNGLGNPGAYPSPVPWGTGGMPFNDGTFRANLTDTGSGSQLSISSIRGNAFQRFYINSSVWDYNVRNAMVATGWNGTAKAVANVYVDSPAGVLGGSSPGSYGLDTGAPWPGPSSIVVRNYGYITGRGGDGGPGGPGVFSPPNGSQTRGSNGGNGGTAFRAQRYTILVNGGTIAGGGGGGGGGPGARNDPPGGWVSGGDGGGGGRSGYPAPGGAGGGASGPTPVAKYTGGAGGTGTVGGAGAGGTGRVETEPGGAGGTWATGGSAGSTNTRGGTNRPGGAGGAGGAAILGWSVIAGSPAGTYFGGVSG